MLRERIEVEYVERGSWIGAEAYGSKWVSSSSLDDDDRWTASYRYGPEREYSEVRYEDRIRYWSAGREGDGLFVKEIGSGDVWLITSPINPQELTTEELLRLSYPDVVILAGERIKKFVMDCMKELAGRVNCTAEQLVLFLQSHTRIGSDAVDVVITTIAGFVIATRRSSSKGRTRNQKDEWAKTAAYYDWKMLNEPIATTNKCRRWRPALRHERQRGG